MKAQGIWFLSLDVISISVVLFVFIKKRDATLIPFYLWMMGCTYIFEYIVKILFDAYTYYPEIHHQRYYDDLLGANASQAFAIPSVALLVAAYGLNFAWMLLFTGVFAGIEELFLHLGIYQQHWWRTEYSIVSILLFLLMSKKWLSLLHCGGKGAIRFVTLLMAGLSFIGSLFFYFTIIFNVHEYATGLLQRHHDNMTFALPFFLMISLLYTVLTFRRTNLLWKALGIAAVLIMDWILWKKGIIRMNRPWGYWYYVIANILMMLLLSWLNRILTRRTKKHDYADAN